MGTKLHLMDIGSFRFEKLIVEYKDKRNCFHNYFIHNWKEPYYFSTFFQLFSNFWSTIGLLFVSTYEIHSKIRQQTVHIYHGLCRSSGTCIIQK